VMIFTNGRGDGDTRPPARHRKGTSYAPQA
jgi:hypothetical protein